MQCLMHLLLGSRENKHCHKAKLRTLKTFHDANYKQISGKNSSDRFKAQQFSTTTFITWGILHGKIPICRSKVGRFFSLKIGEFSRPCQQLQLQNFGSTERAKLDKTTMWWIFWHFPTGKTWWTSAIYCKLLVGNASKSPQQMSWCIKFRWFQGNLAQFLMTLSISGEIWSPFTQYSSVESEKNDEENQEGGFEFLKK